MVGNESAWARESSLTRVLGVVDVRILGPVEVVDSAGTTVPVAGLRPKALLAYLALRRPHGASSDRILDEVWFDHPPASMETTLQVTVSRLRKAIGSERVTTTADGYLLDLPPSNTDLDRFRLHAKRGRQLETLGQHARASEAFRQSLAEWRGPALSDVRQIEFAERAASLLDEERMNVVEDLMSSTMAAGDHRLVVGELGGLVESFPYRERIWELLMLALYRSGRQADALAVFGRAQTALGESLGVEPSQALVDLEERILLHDSALELSGADVTGAYPDQGIVLKFPAGAVIVDEGEQADTVYWIEEGTVEVASATVDGSSAVVAELGPGRYFGELAALLGTRRTATVTALTPTRLTLHDTASFRLRIGSERTRAPLTDSIVDVQRLIDGGQYLAAFDVASALIDIGESNAHIRYLAVLALARSGATNHARRQYDTLGLGKIDADSLSPSLCADVAVLSARLDKDQALASAGKSRVGWAERAARGYQDAFERSSAHYHAVNAATMWLVSGHRSDAVDTADRALVVLEKVRAHDYWSRVSEAEAALIVGDVARAERALKQAATTAGAGFAARATTLKQLRLVLAILDLDSSLLHPLENPTVVHYCGHVILPRGEGGRFPALEEASVAEELRATFEQLDVGFGFGSLAAGADILAAEALLERGADLHVVLPFPQEEFVRTSVDAAGADWASRFERCLGAAASVRIATTSESMDDPVLYDYCARVAMGDALIHSRHLETNAHQVAVWDRTPSSGVAGTAIDVGHWTASGNSSTIVPVTPGPIASEAEVPQNRRHIRAILFADFAAFSRLTDAQILVFQEEVMEEFSGALEAFQPQILSGRTWGDGVYLVFDDIPSAAECALVLQDRIGAMDFGSLGLSQIRGLRIAAHATPVFEGWDPISGSRLFYGAGVTETARIEPRTPEGEIYTTHSFAALAVLGGSRSFDCQYVGTVPTAKDYGELPLYALRKRVV